MADFHFPQTALDQGISYADYRALSVEQAAAGQTSGPQQTQLLVDFTKLNAQRMKRLDKTLALDPDFLTELQSITRAMVWVIFTETWCGDAAQNVPMLQLMANASEAIELKLLFRDEHLNLMDRYRTDGGLAIPKLVVLDAETRQELGVWGPRPEPLQRKVQEVKANPEAYDIHQVKTEFQTWYNNDRGFTLQAEVRALLAACQLLATA